MSIRASYGLAYDFVNGQFFINTSNAPPWGSETRITGNVPFDAPFSTGVANIFPVAFDVNAPFSLVGPFIALKPNTKNPEVHSWNLSIQKQVGTAWLFSASYVGNETEHLWVSTAGNPGVFGPGATTANLQARRVLSLTGNPDAKYIGFLDFFDDGGTQSYNGLLLAATRRLSRGISLNANYTWSHCIGDFTQGGQTPNVGTGFIDPNNRRYDRGPCSGCDHLCLGSPPHLQSHRGSRDAEVRQQRRTHARHRLEVFRNLPGVLRSPAQRHHHHRRAAERCQRPASEFGRQPVRHQL